MVYLDYAANTPVDKEVLDVFYDTTLKYFANPNSIHKLGIEAEQMLNKSTHNIASKFKLFDSEIIYTSGATESNNLAIKGVCEMYKNKGKHIIVSSLEHNSIIAAATSMQELGFEVDVVGVNKDGLIDIDELKSLIRDDTILVSICAVDSEVGIRQPIEEIGKFLHNYPNVIFHSDATGAIGRINIDISNIDLVTFTPHKFYGLNGMGVLVKKENISLKPQINGGRSTTIFRSGTPVLANVIACDKALDKALKTLDERLKYVIKLNNEITQFLSKYPKVHINNTKNSIPFIVNFSIKGIKSIDVIKKLEEKDIYVSAKISCCPTETPSKLIYALTKDKGLASSSLRLSICHLTTEEELDKFYKAFDEIYEKL